MCCVLYMLIYFGISDTYGLKGNRSVTFVPRYFHMGSSLQLRLKGMSFCRYLVINLMMALDNNMNVFTKFCLNPSKVSSIHSQGDHDCLYQIAWQSIK